MPYEERQAKTERELGTTSYRLVEIRATSGGFPGALRNFPCRGDTRL